MEYVVESLGLTSCTVDPAPLLHDSSSLRHPGLLSNSGVPDYEPGLKYANYLKISNRIATLVPKVAWCFPTLTWSPELFLARLMREYAPTSESLKMLCSIIWSLLLYPVLNIMVKISINALELISHERTLCRLSLFGKFRADQRFCCWHHLPQSMAGVPF